MEEKKQSVYRTTVMLLFFLSEDIAADFLKEGNL